MPRSFPFYAQPDAKDCGPTCLKIISKYYGKYFELQTLRNKSKISKEGVTMLGISKAAESIGFKTIGAQVEYNTLLEGAPLPCIAHWNQNHFIVLYKITKRNVYIADPAKEKLKYAKADFINQWARTVNSNNAREGLVLLLEPTDAFYNTEGEKKIRTGYKFLSHYVAKYPALIVQLFLILICASLFQLIFPFLTKSLVDNGIINHDISFIYLILGGQLMLFAGKTITDFIRSWILLHVTSRINISIISDFFYKLMKLPLSYFDSKVTGDILQRVNDHNKIEHFLTGSALNTLFSLISLFVFSFVLATYNKTLFIIFSISALIYCLWVTIFLKQRRILDYRKFEISSKSSGKVIQMISGMQEIKLNNSEQQKRGEWEKAQASLFKINVRSLTLNQYQQVGAFFINEGKNILLTFLSAKLVIEGSISLGTMLAIQYIIGQLNTPIEQMVDLVQSYQDASISIERLNEIHAQEDEEPVQNKIIYALPGNKTISLKNVSFQYQGAANNKVLEDINIQIPQGKVTAIVGVSGSGKTTLLKLLLKFYKPNTGTIKVSDLHLDSIANFTWRQSCGVVLQDGFIFSDTIAHNIAVGEDDPDMDRLMYSAQMANITDFIHCLPLGFNTMIGDEGNGISEGQKQRLLIARAIYKNPEYIIFDEATNSLDANNEMVIMDNLKEFFKGRTVIIVAHRLSTVKNADQILVLEYGKIIEQGTHETLTNLKGQYYNLVKNQLELGK